MDEAIADLISHLISGAFDPVGLEKFLNDLGPAIDNKARWREFATFSLMMLAFHREKYEKIYSPQYLSKLEEKFQRICGG